MKKEELLKVAIELGIENADALSYQELRKAVAKVKNETANDQLGESPDTKQVGDDTPSSEEDKDNNDSEGDQKPNEIIPNEDTPKETDVSSDNSTDFEEEKVQESLDAIKPTEDLPSSKEVAENDSATEEVLSKHLIPSTDPDPLMETGLSSRTLTPIGSSNSEEVVTVEAATSYIDSSGREFAFSEQTPEKFRFNNRLQSKEEWLQDQDVMEALILGNNSYVKQIFEE